MGTVFSKILAGELPCFRVYEDEGVLAFLDVGPVSRGHVLVIPKEPAVTLDELSDAAAAALGVGLTRVAAGLMAALKDDGVVGYNVLQNNGEAAGQVVMHVHFHLIPKYADGSGLQYEWQAGALEEEAERLREVIAGAV